MKKIIILTHSFRRISLSAWPPNIMAAKGAHGGDCPSLLVDGWPKGKKCQRSAVFLGLLFVFPPEPTAYRTTLTEVGLPQLILYKSRHRHSESVCVSPVSWVILNLTKLAKARREGMSVVGEFDFPFDLG